MKPASRHDRTEAPPGRALALVKTQAREQPRLEKLFYRAREIAIITGLGRTVVYELMSAGDFGPVVKIGDARLVSAAGLMAWAETKIQEAQEALEE